MIKEEIIRILSGIRDLNDQESIYKMIDALKETLILDDLVNEKGLFKNVFKIDRTLYISGRLFYYTLGSLVGFIIFAIIFKI